MKSITLIILGSLSAAFGIKGFLVSSHFIDGGVTGVSMLLNNIFGFPVWILLCLLNLPFIIFGHRQLGKTFVIKSIFSILVLSIAIAVIPFPDVTPDKLLTALFGGFFLGAGIGLSVRGGAVIDGTEVLAIFLSRKLRTTIGDIIIIINILIFGVAAYFLSLEIALYSMITYLSASKTLDFIIEGIDEYTRVTIISASNDKMRKMIIEKLGRGVTVYNGKRGYGKTGEAKEIEIVYTVVTRLELNRLNTEIEKIDPAAFVVTCTVKDTKGGMIKKRPLEH